MPGLLVAIEGNNGLGKTTQCEMLLNWAKQKAIPAIVIKARISSLVSNSINMGRSNHIRAEVQALLFAAGLYEQIYSQGISLIQGGGLVIADRWSFSPISREAVRGVDEIWLRLLYSLLPKPNQVFILTAPPQVALSRVASIRPPGYWESGQDVYPTLSRTEAFLQFQQEITARLLAEARIACSDEELVLLDATLPPEMLHVVIVERIRKFLGQNYE